jgi:hypothetical protein
VTVVEGDVVEGEAGGDVDGLVRKARWLGAEDAEEAVGLAPALVA